MILFLILIQVNSQSISHRYMFPVPVSGAQLISLSNDEKLFSFSGRKSPSELHEGTSILNYDFSSGTYQSTQIPGKISPVARSNYGLCFVDNKWIYLFGGLGDEGALGDMWRFDIEENYWKLVFENSVISPRFSFAFSSYYDEAIGITSFTIVGGLGRSQQGLQDFYSIEISGETINEIKVMPSIETCIKNSIFGAQLQFVTNYYYLFSGSHQFRSSEKSYYKGLCRFSISDQQWEEIDVYEPLVNSVHGGSFLYDNSIYYFFGKNEEKFINQIYRLDLSSVESGWSQVNLKIQNECERAEFGYTLIIEDIESNKYVLFSSGATKYGYTNSIGYIDIIDDENFQVSCMIEVKNSPPRSKASISQISDTLILFGGTNEGKYFNDLWRVNYTGDIHLYNWTLIKALGNYPEPRMGHAAASQGHFMLIAGGINEKKSYLSDYWLLDTTDLKYRWIEIVPESYSSRPPPLAFSCVVLDIPYFYLIGGESTDFLSSEIWRYHLSENIFEKASIHFKSISRHGCHIDRIQKSILIFFGSQNLENEPNQEIFNISMFDFKNISSTAIIFKNKIAGRSNFGYSVINSVLFIAGGQEYFSKSYSNILALDLINLTATELSQNSSEDDNPYEIEQGLHSMSFATVGGKIILYSGIEGNGDSLNMKSSDSIYMINLISYPEYNTSCGLGSTSNGTHCLPCSKNSYKDKDYGRCKRCPAGNFINNTGSTDSIQCIPCPYGYYVSSSQEVECIKCKVGTKCFVGESQENEEVSIYEPTQPKIISPKNNLVFVYALFSVTGVLILFFIVFWMFIKKVKLWLNANDLFKNHHLDPPVVINETAQKPPFNSEGVSQDQSKTENPTFFSMNSFKSKTTIDDSPEGLPNLLQSYSDKLKSKLALAPIGGFFTGVAFIIFFSVLTYYCYTYTNNNTSENITLVSSSTIISKQSYINQDLQVYIDFSSLRNFDCKKSFAKISQSSGIKISQSPSKIQKGSHCTFFLKVSKDEVFQSGDYIEFIINCSDCYTSDITVAVEADAAYHNMKSRATSNLTVDDGTVLKGKVPSRFFFELAPAMADDLTERKQESKFGYRVASILRPEIGSTSDLSILFLSADVKVNIEFSLSQTGVYTADMLKVDVFGFLGLAVGALNGSMAMIMILMKISEIMFFKIRYRKQKTMSSYDLMLNRAKTGVLPQSENLSPDAQVNFEEQKIPVGSPVSRSENNDSARILSKRAEDFIPEGGYKPKEKSGWSNQTYTFNQNDDDELEIIYLKGQ